MTYASTETLGTRETLVLKSVLRLSTFPGLGFHWSGALGILALYSGVFLIKMGFFNGLDVSHLFLNHGIIEPFMLERTSGNLSYPTL